MGTSYADAPVLSTKFPITFKNILYGVWANLPFLSVDATVRANFFYKDEENYTDNLIGFSLDHSLSGTYTLLSNWIAMGI